MRLLVKYKGKCAECGNEIPAGDYALWSRSNKAIKHLRCKVQKLEKEYDNPEVLELDCFICGRSAGCSGCSFEIDCDRRKVSQACICSLCLEDKQAYQNYKEAFIQKAHKVVKVKI
jgi:hypothetical protein